MAIHEKSVIVNAPVDEVYSMWCNFENFPRFMKHVKEVKMLDGNMSHWKGEVAGISEEWDAKTVDAEKNKTIGWESTSGFQNKGTIKFDETDQGTKITVHFEYDPPASVLGDIAEAVYVGREFDEDLEEDLKNFKQRTESKKAA